MNPKLYYHHVGQEGAALDYTKTILTKVRIADIKKFISPKIPTFQQGIYKHLDSDCPDNQVCCWGVPKGADYKIDKLKRGDFILLIESLDSPFMILCEVIAYIHFEQRTLSKFLWNTDRFPYIFFLDFKFVQKSWLEFCHIIGYSQNYNPRCLFLSVDDLIVYENGGLGNLINKLKKN